jgi:hypothetical protein
MLDKCANPACTVPFRKLGSGRLFAFESVTIVRSQDPDSRGAIGRVPMFFWLCEYCTRSFTLKCDSAGELTLHQIPDGVRVEILEGCALDHRR